MKCVWKKHTIGKRILALFLLVIMLFDTVTAHAMTYNGEESTQDEMVEVVESSTEISSEIVTKSEEIIVSEEVIPETETESVTEEVGIETETKVTTEEHVTETESVTE